MNTTERPRRRSALTPWPTPWLALATVLSTLLSAAACEGRRSVEDDQGGAQKGASELEPAPPLPETRAEFLAELAPLPEGLEGLELRYEVKGEIAEGTYLVQMRPGGYRRESWSIRWEGIIDPDSDEEAARSLVSEGTTITTPSHTWSARTGEDGELRSNHLETFASAWYSLAGEPKAAAMAGVREWHQVLTEERAKHPGELATVHGVACLQTRIAAQNLCMWEEAGVFLRYEGAVFNVELVSLNRKPELTDDLFDISTEAASRAKRMTVTPLDYAVILDELTQGNYEALAALVAPEALGADAFAPPTKIQPG